MQEYPEKHFQGTLASHGEQVLLSQPGTISALGEVWLGKQALRPDG